jgi:hypothetical protein
VGEDGDEPEEIETVQQKGGEVKLPYPLQNDVGGEPDRLKIKDMKGEVVLEIVLEVQGKTGK